VRNIVEGRRAVARGDLSRKITVDVKGRILELEGTLKHDGRAQLKTGLRIGSHAVSRGEVGHPERATRAVQGPCTKACGCPHVEGILTDFREFNGVEPHPTAAPRRVSKHRQCNRPSQNGDL